MNAGFLSLYDPQRGTVPAFLQDGEVFDLSEVIGVNILGLIRTRKLNSQTFFAELQERLTPSAKYPFGYEALWRQSPRSAMPHLKLPFAPPEVWGVGVSFKRTAELHEEDLRSEGLAPGLYAYVFESERPEIFFKATARHCVGHGDPFAIRGDSHETIVEAELACIYDNSGSIVAYSIANDITAWDIEKESPLFLSYAKIFDASCVLGPLVVPAHLVRDPLSLEVRCCVERQGRVIYKGEGNTGNMKRTLKELSAYLTYCNAVPDGTILCTGTAVGIPKDVIMENGDKVSIRIDHLGEQVSVARRCSPMQSWSEL